MNKNLIIGVVAVVLLIGGMIMYQKAKGTSLVAPMMEKNDGALGMINGTLADLAAKGVPMQCSFKSTVDGVESSGTVYVSGKNMRGDFKGMYDGKEESTHMIRSDDTNYIWSDGDGKGMMMKISAEDVESLKKNMMEVQKSNPQAVDVDGQTMDYNCKSWVPEGTSFTPPTDIEFTDMSAMMNQMKKMMPSGVPLDTMEDAQCAVCMQLPEGEARDQCKVAMKCQ